MSQLLKIFMRFVAVTFGFSAACLTAAAAYAFLSGFIRPDDFDTYNGVELGISITIMMTGLTAKFAQVAFAPTLIMIIIFEISSIRDWLAYIALSAAISLIALFTFSAEFNDYGNTALYVVSAVAGGFIYWLFVGQRAGKWRIQ